METVSSSPNYQEMPNAHENKEEVFICPTCKEQVLESEIERHFEFEKERLQELKLGENTDSSSANTDSSGAASVVERKSKQIYQRVRRNRHTRLKQRSRKRTASTPPPPIPSPQEHTCPLCTQTYPQDVIQSHVEQCLRRVNGTTDSTTANDGGNSSNDEDDLDDDVYEEYEWAGQKRIRTSSLLRGGYSSLGIGQTIKSNKNESDEEEDLNVDEDDTQIYGPAQYREADIIPPGNEEGYIRHLMSTDVNAADSILNRTEPGEVKSSEVKHNNNSTEVASTSADALPSTSSNLRLNGSRKLSTQYQQIIDALRIQLKQHEKNKYKCLICLDEYRNPAISVCCWHVHCEECWLRTLGSRKLCPQCNLITTAKDLRRIYL